MRRALAFAAVILVLVPIAALLLLSGDDAAPEDAALRPPAPAAADADNAWAEFQALEKTLRISADERKLIDRALAGEARAADEAAPLVARSAEALGLLRVFARKPAFVVPAFSDPTKIDFETPIPQFWPVVVAAKLASLRAASRPGSPEALDDAFAILDAGNTLASAPQPLIVHLVGVLLRDIGAKRLSDVAQRGRLDRARLIAAAQRAAAYPGTASGLQHALRFEYVSATRTIERLPETSSRHARAARSGYLFKPNRTKGLFAAHFRPLIEEAGKPCLLARAPEHEARRPFILKPNLVGGILFSIAIPSYGKLYTRRCENDFRVASAAVDAALAAYKLDRGGGAPKTLAELVPAYLDRVPDDPYSGEPLAYSAGAVRTEGKNVDGGALTP